MLITVEVGLLSGRKASVEADLEGEVDLLQRRARAALGIGRGRLVDSSGSILDSCVRRKDAGVRNGDRLTFHVRRVQACASISAFAAILGDGVKVAPAVTVVLCSLS